MSTPDNTKPGDDESRSGAAQGGSAEHTPDSDATDNASSDSAFIPKLSQVQSKHGKDAPAAKAGERPEESPRGLTIEELAEGLSQELAKRKPFPINNFAVPPPAEPAGSGVNLEEFGFHVNVVEPVNQSKEPKTVPEVRNIAAEELQSPVPKGLKPIASSLEDTLPAQPDANPVSPIAISETIDDEASEKGDTQPVKGPIAIPASEGLDDSKPKPQVALQQYDTELPDDTLAVGDTDSGAKTAKAGGTLKPDPFTNPQGLQVRPSIPIPSSPSSPSPGVPKSESTGGLKVEDEREITIPPGSVQARTLKPRAKTMPPGSANVPFSGWQNERDTPAPEKESPAPQAPVPAPRPERLSQTVPEPDKEANQVVMPVAGSGTIESADKTDVVQEVTSESKGLKKKILTIGSVILLCVASVGVMYDNVLFTKRIAEKNKEELKPSGSDSQSDSYKTAADADPDNPEDQLQLALSLEKQKKYEEAVQHFDTLLEINKTSASALHGRGRVLTKLQQYDKAKDDLEKAASLEPKNEQVMIDLAAVKYLIEDYAGAAREYERILRVHRDDVDALYGRGISYAAIKKNELAIKDFESAVRLRPTYDKAYRQMCTTYLAMGKNDKAEAAITVAIKACGPDAELHFSRGLSRYKMGMKEEALEDYDEAIKLNPDRKEYYNDRGFVLMQLGRNKEARADFEQSLKIDPEYSLAIENLKHIDKLPGG